MGGEKDGRERKQEKGNRPENMTIMERKQKIRLHKYIGETGRSAYERGKEHTSDRDKWEKGSHMLKHIILEHEGEDEVVHLLANPSRGPRSHHAGPCGLPAAKREKVAAD